MEISVSEFIIFFLDFCLVRKKLNDVIWNDI